MILLREKCTSSRSRDHHGLFFMNKQRMCVWAPTPQTPNYQSIIEHSQFINFQLSENRPGGSTSPSLRGLNPASEAGGGAATWCIFRKLEVYELALFNWVILQNFPQLFESVFFHTSIIK